MHPIRVSQISAQILDYGRRSRQAFVPCRRHKTGYGSYGPPAGWQRGARLLELRLGHAIQQTATWIRLEDGTVEQQTGPFAQPGENAEPLQTVCNAGADFCDVHRGAASCRAEP